MHILRAGWVLHWEGKRTPQPHPGGLCVLNLRKIVVVNKQKYMQFLFYVSLNVLCVWPRVSQNRLGWAWTCDPTASASHVQGSQCVLLYSALNKFTWKKKLGSLTHEIWYQRVCVTRTWPTDVPCGERFTTLTAQTFAPRYGGRLGHRLFITTLDAHNEKNFLLLQENRWSTALCQVLYHVSDMVIHLRKSSIYASNLETVYEPQSNLPALKLASEMQIDR